MGIDQSKVLETSHVIITWLGLKWEQLLVFFNVFNLVLPESDDLLFVRMLKDPRVI